MIEVHGDLLCTMQCTVKIKRLMWCKVKETANTSNPVNLGCHQAELVTISDYQSLVTYLSIICHHTILDGTRKSACAIGGQWTIRCTTGVIVSRFHSLLCCWFTSRENQLTITFGQMDCIATFKCHLKTKLLFMDAYCAD